MDTAGFQHPRLLNSVIRVMSAFGDKAEVFRGVAECLLTIESAPCGALRQIKDDALATAYSLPQALPEQQKGQMKNS
jgi:hypothetical protein